MRDTEAQLIFETYVEAKDVSRRDFFKLLGRGAATVATVPWTKLLSAPKLAAAVTAPFKIGAGTILNPQALHWHYVNMFNDKAKDSGITPVDVTDERHYEYEHVEISYDAFEWVSKNIINMYVNDVGHSTDREGDTIAPTLFELINNHGWDVEHFIDDPNFPEWAKPLIGKDEDDLTEEEREKYDELMNAKWFDTDLVKNWDGEFGPGDSEELDQMLRSWTGWKGKAVDFWGAPGPRDDFEQKQFMVPSSEYWPRNKWDTPTQLIDSVFDYIIDLNRQGKDIYEIKKMNFQTEFLPGVVTHIREIAVAQQNFKTSSQQKQAGQDAQKAKDELQKDQLPRRPGEPEQWDDVEANPEWWTDRDFEWWSHRFDDDIINSDKIEQYKVIATNISNHPFQDGFRHTHAISDIPVPYAGMDKKEIKDAIRSKIKTLKMDAGAWLKWYNDEGKHLRKPNQAHIKHPYGVGSPQSGLQTASYKPTFKEYFNK